MIRQDSTGNGNTMSRHLETLNADQLASNSKEVDTLKKLFENEKQEVQNARINYSEKERSYVESLNEYKIENDSLKDALRKQKSERQRAEEDLRGQLQGTSL